jgi:hypothetical protein
MLSLTRSSLGTVSELIISSLLLLFGILFLLIESLDILFGLRGDGIILFTLLLSESILRLQPGLKTSLFGGLSLQECLSDLLPGGKLLLSMLLKLVV